MLRCDPRPEFPLRYRARLYCPCPGERSACRRELPDGPSRRLSNPRFAVLARAAGHPARDLRISIDPPGAEPAKRALKRAISGQNTAPSFFLGDAEILLVQS